MAQVYGRSTATTSRVARWAIYITAIALTRAVASPAAAVAQPPATLPACTADSAQALRESGPRTAYEGGPATPGAGVRELSDGGKIYSYEVGDQTVEYPVPPESFDARTATDEQLERYNFPPRPSDPAALAEWDKTFGNDAKPVPPGGCVSDEFAEEEFASEDEVTLNWAGFENPAQGHPSHFGAVTGEYGQPAYHSTSCAEPHEVSWTGLGGDFSSNLIQDGTGMTASEYFAWYEILPSPLVRVSLTVKSGDLIQDYVTYSGGTIDFWVYNHSRETYSHTTFTGMSGSYNGSSAEYIDERPSVGGSLANLANFEKVNWQEGKAYNNVTGAWEGIAGSEHLRLHMWNNAETHQLAAPGFLSSGTSFQDNWLACN
jgi:Peptidase A4 family